MMNAISTEGGGFSKSVQQHVLIPTIGNKASTLYSAQPWHTAFNGQEREFRWRTPPKTRSQQTVTSRNLNNQFLDPLSLKLMAMDLLLVRRPLRLYLTLADGTHPVVPQVSLVISHTDTFFWFLPAQPPGSSC